jgi:DNA end-binding protein Ku
MIERKAEGQEIVVEAPEEEPQKVPDLMAALEASIAGAKRQGGEAKKPRKKAASSNGSTKKKKTAAKK